MTTGREPRRGQGALSALITALDGKRPLCWSGNVLVAFTADVSDAELWRAQAEMVLDADDFAALRSLLGVVESGHDEQTEAVAWILWGKQNDDTKPLGAYSDRGVALVAEQAAEAHSNTDAFDDFWVTPWPLQDKPTLNFRIGMERPEWQPDPRTVAAVVEALLDNPKGRNRVLTVGQAVDRIEERSRGGADGH